MVLPERAARRTHWSQELTICGGNYGTQPESTSEPRTRRHRPRAATRNHRKRGRRSHPVRRRGHQNGDSLVGEIAKRQAVTNIKKYRRIGQRHMGTDWSTEIGGKKMTAPSFGRILKPGHDAEEYLQEKVTDAVITVPILQRC